ncbi:MAG TPA: hypothetical protein VGZ22_31115, partial [Isosphaeraceae bacterium]|nr:hypothetical protein [Isosphaeraceae bacterium]
MRSRTPAWLVLSVVLGTGLAASGNADLPSARQTMTPVAPVLPTEVVAAMQEGRWGEAVAALERMAGDPKIKEVDRGYLALVRGIAERQAG